MFKKHFLFLSIFMQGLYGAAQENSTFNFKIAGYDNIITVINYHSYQTLENMFDDLGSDETETETATFTFPPFITHEIVDYLEEIVRSNTINELNNALKKIYSGHTDNHYSKQPKNAQKLLTILLAAQFLEIKNPIFNFETIIEKQEKLTAIKNLPLNFLSLVIARCMNIYGESIIKKQFMDEYQAYITDKNLTNKPLLSFIQQYEDALKQLSDGTGDTCFLSAGNIFIVVNNFLEEVKTGNYSYVHNGNNLRFILRHEGEAYTMRYATLATARNTVLILNSNADRMLADRLDLLDIETNTIKPICEVQKPARIPNATISQKGKYILITLRFTSFLGSNQYKLVIYEKKEEGYAPIIEHVLDNNSTIHEAWYSQIVQTRDRYNSLQAISLPKYNPVFLQFNENEDTFFIIDSKLHKLSVFHINNKNLIEISTLDRGIAQAAQWIDNVNLLVDHIAYSHERNWTIHTHYYFNTKTNNLSDPLITNTSTDEFISFCLLNGIKPTHIQYNTKDNYYLTRELDDQTAETPAFKIYKRFILSYIQSLPFIDQLFLSICSENHGCPLDDRLMHQHYFSFITEQFDPVTRTIKKQTKPNIAGNNSLQQSTLIDTGTPESPSAENTNQAKENEKTLMRKARLKRFDPEGSSGSNGEAAANPQEQQPAVQQSLRQEVKEQWENVKSLFERTKSKIGLL